MRTKRDNGSSTKKGRAVKAEIGARQYRKQRKALATAAREFA